MQNAYICEQITRFIWTGAIPPGDDELCQNMRDFNAQIFCTQCFRVNKVVVALLHAHECVNSALQSLRAEQGTTEVGR